MVSAASSRRLSNCTTPVSDSRGRQSTGRVSVRSKIQRGAGVRIVTAISGRSRPSSLRTSMSREAWPKPWPDTYHAIVATNASERRAQDVVERSRGDEGHVAAQVLGDVFQIGSVQRRQDERV